MRIIPIVCSFFFISTLALGFSRNYVEAYSVFSEIKNSAGLILNFEPEYLVLRFSIDVSDYGEFRNFEVYERFYFERDTVRLYELQTRSEIGVSVGNLKFFLVSQMEILSFYTHVINFYYGGGVGLSVGMFYLEGKVDNLNLFTGTFNFETILSVTDFNDLLKSIYLHFSKDNVSYPSVGVYSEIRLLEFDWFELYFGAGISLNFHQTLLPYKVKLKVCLSEYELFFVSRFSQSLVEAGVGIHYSFWM